MKLTMNVQFNFKTRMSSRYLTRIDRVSYDEDSKKYKAKTKVTCSQMQLINAGTYEKAGTRINLKKWSNRGWKTRVCYQCIKFLRPWGTNKNWTGVEIFSRRSCFYIISIKGDHWSDSINSGRHDMSNLQCSVPRHIGDERVPQNSYVSCTYVYYLNLN